MTTDPITRTLAAYALAMMHGAQLADFERENVIALAKQVGVDVTQNHRTMQADLQTASAAKDAEMARLRTALLEKQKPWWRRWV